MTPKPPCEKCGKENAKRRFFLGSVFRLCAVCAPLVAEHLASRGELGLGADSKTNTHKARSAQ